LKIDSLGPSISLLALKARQLLKFGTAAAKNEIIFLHSGFAPQNAMTAQIALPPARYREPEQRARFFQQLSELARALPGVQAVGAISNLPLDGGAPRTSIAIEGRAEKTSLAPQARPRIHPRTVTPDYFEAMGIPLLSGRRLTSKDDSKAPLVALINQTAAQRYWPGQNPLGHRAHIGGGNP
jgi:putative ABC transport system permease protein